MSEKKPYTEFRQMLHKGVYDYGRTQADFARAAGLAPETLNRLMNNELISRPSLLTLKKLASVMGNNITVEDMMKACGYPVADNELTDTQRIDRFTDTLDELSKVKGAYESLNDFANTLAEMFTDEDVSYEIGTVFDLTDKDTNKESKAVVITFSFALDPANMTGFCSVASAITVYYSETVFDKIIVDRIDIEAETAASYGSKIAERLLALRNGSFVAKYRNILSYKRNNRRTLESLSAEQRLLKAIFGQEEGKQPEIMRIQGIGFYIPDNLPDFVIKRFFEKHCDSFCRSEKEEEIYNSIMNNGDVKALFHNYRTETRTGAGSYSWLGAIVNIIYREQNINVQGWYNNDIDSADIEHNMNCIVFADSMPWDFNYIEGSLSKNKLLEILDEYARELHSNMSRCEFLANVYR